MYGSQVKPLIIRFAQLFPFIKKNIHACLFTFDLLSFREKYNVVKCNYKILVIYQHIIRE